MRPTRAQLEDLLRAVAVTAPEEIDCDEFLARVGAYLEGLERTGGHPPELEQVSHHLKVCPECREEFEALVALHLGD